MGLPGPSRTIEVEPQQVPDKLPEPKPVKEPVKVPEREKVAACA